MPEPSAAPPAAPERPRRSGDGQGQGKAPDRGAGWKVEPSSTGRGAPPPPTPPMLPQGRRGTWAMLLLVLLIVNLVFAFVTARPSDRAQVPYQPFFTQQVEKGNVKEISSQEETIQGELKKEATYQPPGGDKVTVTKFKTQVPTFVTTEQLTQSLSEQGVVVNAEPPDSGRSILSTLILGFGPTILLIAIFIWIFRRQASGGGLGGFGRSTARRVQPSNADRVTFEDVAGIDEVEHELAEIVDMLKNPQRYERLGARIPRGVLLYGPPGTGKTLLARAVAGEADAAFFSMSASEFIEAIVGIGASRVRDLFKQAKEAAPAIIFIDELDAIGRSRSGNVGGISGGHDEREQTLNQILTEMDGFEVGTTVIVLAATNRPEILDPALLRPGRFDRRIAVQPPDKPGRVAILKIHTRKVPLAGDVELERVAASTPGMTGADIALLVNEASLFAARRGHAAVTSADFGDAIEKIILGTERQVVMSEADRERTAYHESGHALVGMLTPGADPVRKISIIPRGQALGVTLSTPETDRYNYALEDLRGKIKVALGGRVAERLVYGDLTTGAESDIQNLTQIARGMVGRWGMSEAIGPVAVTDGRSDGGLLPGVAPTSAATQQLVDEEVRRIIDDAEHDVLLLLERERERLDRLTHILLDRETLDGPEAYAAAGLAAPDLDVQDEAHATTIAPGATDLSVAGSGEAPTA
ncbi:ATP-dependent zinc metalloprotease FtsH [Capillimicrobium parvum]|uniref:ATP-dependent zinc metalloprotease FtsH n=1 Tax=Capillimicrobium parvum TaxID=2884022 RepID=A0A9E6XYP3_9ACTN|nr:ATP-dependent zinc metalloprotease FtsH [Capillimicrobium parvum]UGS36398.1 ATP-dependent zinc metalloprotease FtsH 4 [Capillimicrobium parvum]